MLLLLLAIYQAAGVAAPAHGACCTSGSTSVVEVPGHAPDHSQDLSVVRSIIFANYVFRKRLDASSRPQPII
ncbi:hypothetical protein WJX74_004511 [Apatococcus lobatus]|uniref:Secreted protein n=1 Tax=Apatococcus lobatus TaxID=904363 RepID=A0AAW1QYJ2_9CHLO